MNIIILLIFIVIVLILMNVDNLKENFYYEKNIKSTDKLPRPISLYPKENAQQFYERKFETELNKPFLY